MIEVLKRIKELAEKDDIDISSLEEVERIINESLEKKEITDVESLERYQKEFNINFKLHLNTIFLDNHFLEDYRKISDGVIKEFLRSVEESKRNLLLREKSSAILSHFNDDFSLKGVLSNEELDAIFASIEEFTDDPKEMLTAIKDLLEENIRVSLKEKDSEKFDRTMRRLSERSTHTLIDNAAEEKRRSIIAKKEQESAVKKEEKPIEEEKQESKIDKSIKLFRDFAFYHDISYSDEKNYYKKYLAKNALHDNHDIDSRLGIYFIDKNTLHVEAIVQDALYLINEYEKDKSNTEIENLICSISDVLFTPTYISKLYEASKGIFVNMYPSKVIECYRTYHDAEDKDSVFRQKVEDILKEEGITSSNYVDEFLEHCKVLGDMGAACDLTNIDSNATLDKEVFGCLLSYHNFCISKFNIYASKYMDILHCKINSNTLDARSAIIANEAYNELFDRKEIIGDGPDSIIFMKILPVLHGKKDFIDLNSLAYSINDSVLNAFLLDDNDNNKIFFFDVLGDNTPGVISKIRDFIKNGSGDKLADIAEKFDFLRRGENCKKIPAIDITINHKKYSVWECRCNANAGGQMRLYYVPLGDYACVIDLIEKKNTAISKGSKKSVKKRPIGIDFSNENFEEMFERTKVLLSDEAKRIADQRGAR